MPIRPYHFMIVAFLALAWAVSLLSTDAKLSCVIWTVVCLVSYLFGTMDATEGELGEDGRVE